MKLKMKYMELEMGREIKQEDLEYKTKNYTFDFQQYKTIRSFGESIYTSKASIVEAEEDQINLFKNIVEFNNKSRPRTIEGKQMLQRLPIALAQVKAGNPSKNLLDEMRQTIYPLYRAKEITKKYITIS